MLSYIERMEQQGMIEAVRDLMSRHPHLDWMTIAQRVAVMSGRNERAVIEMVQEEFEE